MKLRWCFFFFFQAEDGIRDADVTGVQTCALPILAGCAARSGAPTPLGRFDWPSHANKPNQLQAFTISPIPKEARLAMMMARKSRIEALSNTSPLPNASQNRMHSATGANVSATTK